MHVCKQDGEAAICSVPSWNLIVPMTSSTLQIQPFPSPWDHARTRAHTQTHETTCMPRSWHANQSERHVWEWKVSNRKRMTTLRQTCRVCCDVSACAHAVQNLLLLCLSRFYFGHAKLKLCAVLKHYEIHFRWGFTTHYNATFNPKTDTSFVEERTFSLSTACVTTKIVHSQTI